MSRMMMYAIIFMFAALAAPAQSPPASAGVVSEWDLQTQLKALSAAAKRLQPIIVQADPKNWRDPQAAQSYKAQWTAAQNEIQYLNGTAEKLAKDPEKLTLVLETFFRMQALESSVSALMEGIRKYYNPALAELLQGALVEHMNNRQRLRSYLVDLAQTKEQEFAIMDKEAQRCRTITSKEAPATPSAKPRSK